MSHEPITTKHSNISKSFRVKKFHVLVFKWPKRHIILRSKGLNKKEVWHVMKLDDDEHYSGHRPSFINEVQAVSREARPMMGTRHPILPNIFRKRMWLILRLARAFGKQSSIDSPTGFISGPTSRVNPEPIQFLLFRINRHRCSRSSFNFEKLKPIRHVCSEHVTQPEHNIHLIFEIKYIQYTC